jgi:hypothetical protein
MGLELIYCRFTDARIESGKFYNRHGLLLKSSDMQSENIQKQNFEGTMLSQRLTTPTETDELNIAL